MFMWHSSFTSMHGAPSHAPRHSAYSSDNLPSRRVVPRLHVQLARDSFEQQLLAAAQHAGNAPADPHAMLPQRVPFLAEELVERHRVVDLGRVQLEQLGDLDDRRRRHRALRIVHDVQRRQRHRLLVRILRELGPDLLASSFDSTPASIQRFSNARRRKGAKANAEKNSQLVKNFTMYLKNLSSSSSSRLCVFA